MNILVRYVHNGVNKQALIHGSMLWSPEDNCKRWCRNNNVTLKGYTLADDVTAALSRE